MSITGNQIGAAMRLLGITSKDVCEGADISNVTMTRVLSGEVAKEKTKQRVVAFLESKGVEFLEHEGVRKKPKATVQQYEGKEGFVAFMKDVLETVTEHGGEVCVSGVDESQFEKFAGEYLKTHISLMTALKRQKDFMFKILVEEGDENLVASSYAEYRHVPKGSFMPVPFYVYGNKLAIIMYRGDDVSISVTESASTANGHREQFNAVWEGLAF